MRDRDFDEMEYSNARVTVTNEEVNAITQRQCLYNAKSAVCVYNEIMYGHILLRKPIKRFVEKGKENEFVRCAIHL